ncbi:hypothetical protein GGG16DRAFT_37325, partial [Schizophyllum commune]
IGGQSETITLHNVLYAPQAVNNLFSIPRVDESGGRATFRDGKVRISNSAGREVLIGSLRHRLYWLDARARRVKNHAGVAD